MSTQIFDVDKEGLAKLLARRGIEFAALELIQNALDENVTTVEVALQPESRGLWTLSVTDDNPEGFADLSHAYTLFAESKKKGNAEKRGRFNLGEKLVIALARKTTISTTTGTIVFDERGRRNAGHQRLEGTKIDTTLKMTRADVEKIVTAVHSLIVPSNVVLVLQVEDEGATRVGSREVMRSFEATLPTEISDAEGYLRPTERKTRIEVYKPREGEKATLYEMGIPVVETGDAWHVNVMQKVPLNSDRDNVTPAYLRRLRTEVLNECIDRIEPEQARAGWVNDVLTDKEVTPETVNTVLTHRYGDKRVIRDPSDPESTKIAVAQGYAVIEPGTFSKSAWENIRTSGAALPSGQVTPSPKPYSEDGKDLTILDPKDYTTGVRIVVAYAERLGKALLGSNRLYVTIAKEAKWPYAATFAYKGYDLTLNMGRLGKDWFENPDLDRINRLLLHEFAHFYSADHLSGEFHEAICKLGAKLARLALDDPKFFRLEES
jgi:hypothetical protein